MTKDDIISLPNKRLRQVSADVKTVSPKIKKVVEDMVAATIDWDKTRDHEVGVALAAVQIDQLYKIIIVRSNFEDKQDNSFNVYINPVITRFEGELVQDFEGCLSVPNVYGKVPRYSKIKLKALDINGNKVSLTAKGFLSRILQHEVDHTVGIVFIDKIKDKPDAFFVLTDEGKLEKLDYKKDVEKNSILWK